MNKKTIALVAIAAAFIGAAGYTVGSLSHTRINTNTAGHEVSKNKVATYSSKGSSGAKSNNVNSENADEVVTSNSDSSATISDNNTMSNDDNSKVSSSNNAQNEKSSASSSSSSKTTSSNNATSSKASSKEASSSKVKITKGADGKYTATYKGKSLAKYLFSLEAESSLYYVFTSAPDNTPENIGAAQIDIVFINKSTGEVTRESEVRDLKSNDNGEVYTIVDGKYLYFVNPLGHLHRINLEYDLNAPESGLCMDKDISVQYIKDYNSKTEVITAVDDFGSVVRFDFLNGETTTEV